MEKISKALWVSAVVIFILTGILTFTGVIYIWFINTEVELPFLGAMFSALIVETIGVCILVLKSTANFMPKTKIYKTKNEINSFLSEFALRGSSVEFVSNRASWLVSDKDLQNKLIKKSRSGNKVAVMSAIKPENISELEENGVEFVNSISNKYTPSARFTLINSTRQGAEELAISMGNFPNHKVYIFDGQNSPYIIAMAKDIIKLMKIIKETKDEQ